MTDHTTITALPRAMLALFLDFDGVLVDIAPTPHAVQVDPVTIPMLTRVSEALGGALAVVSGRPLADIDRYLDNSVETVFGSHGAEFRVAGRTGAPDPSAAAGVEALRAFAAEQFDGIDGVLVEAKPAGLAVHYRNAPAAGDRIREVLAVHVANLPGFELLSGKMIYEARPKGLDKGRAVATLMAEAPFVGRTPVFVGDDTTDEDGMREAIARGGYGVRVGPGESVAQVRLPDRAAVFKLLETLSLQDPAHEAPR